MTDIATTAAPARGVGWYERKRTREIALVVCFLLPSLAIFLLYRVIPLGWNAVLSFQSWSPMRPARWVGWEHYEELLFYDDVFWQALWNTLIWIGAAPIAIVLALVLGVAVAAVTTHHPGDSVALATPQSPAAVSPSFTVGPAPTDRSPSPRRHHSASPSATTTPSTPPPAGPSSTPTSAAAAIAAITIDPGSGPRGTTISVTGTGWTPGSTVSVRYSGALTGGGASATVDARGRFSATVTANAALPGSYTVTASDGSQSDSQPFRQTS